MPDDLSDAREDHRQGRLDRAAHAYERALAENPDRPDALYLLGLLTLQRGDLERAGALLNRAVVIRPDDANYHAALAEVYRAHGLWNRAAASCREAVRLRPDSPANLCNLGAILVDQRDFEAAIGHFRRAIALKPDFIVAHHNLGNALWLIGDSAAACTHLHAALRLDPACAEAHAMLARILLQQGRASEALPHGQETVRLRPDSAANRIALGNVFVVLGRLADAGVCFREALRLRPTLAAAHAGLAEVQEQQGDFDAALASRREALRHDPSHADSLAQLATRLRGALPEAEQAAIERLLAGPGLSADRRASLLFGLGQVCEARREYDRAAALAAEANALQRADLSQRGRGYDPRAFSGFVDQVIAGFTPEFFARVRGWGVETTRPVFVVGLPRSGTTLVEQILASHPRVFGAGESRLVRETFHALPEATGCPGSLGECLDQLGPDAVQQLARRYLDGISALNDSADRVVDKMPENYVYLGLIAALFPCAKLIHCRRDVRDVALSCWMTYFGQLRWACDSDHIASRVAEYHRIMEHWRQTLPIPVLDVDYEAVVADLEPQARRLVTWCDLEWEPSCLEFHKTRRAVQTVSVAQVRQPIYTSSVGRWKHYEQVLARLFANLDHSG